MGDNQGYGIITRHMAAMQSELFAMNKRRASTLDSAAGVGGSGRQKKKCMQGNTPAGQGAARIASRSTKSVGVASNPAKSADVASNPTQGASVASNPTQDAGVALSAARDAGGTSSPAKAAALTHAGSVGVTSNPV
jgi:hypothetical protein